ncbi:MAG: hypothetical protein Q9M92_07015 [Enterobacterales bacterium]|nr:hypothetical protein [Enterobacterales bacterium]
MRKIILILLMLIGSGPVVADSVYDEIAEQYVRLVLALGVHDSGYVDAYYGPQQWLKKAQQKKISLNSIILASDHILKYMTQLDPNDEMTKLRKNYLKTQLAALKSKAEILDGRIKLDFDQESQALFDSIAPHFPMSDFDQALNALSENLPGDGSLAERAKAFKKQFFIPKDKLLEVFKIAIAECRKRTQQYIDLPNNETFKLEFVTHKPWSGYNWYKGNSFSLIQVNIEHPIAISRAIDLGCHEGYPGHHTYNALLEKNLSKNRGWIEYSVYPLFSPQSLIAEGSANYGIELAFPKDDKLTFEKEELFPIAGIDPNLAESYEKITKLLKKLKYVGNEIARQYLDGKIDRKKAIELVQHYSLVDKKKAAQRVRFFDTYRSYVINYNWGNDMVKNWVESGKDKTQAAKWQRFKMLLSSPRLPSDLKI